MKKKEVIEEIETEVVEEQPITPIDVDFSSEQLNNLARKLNEVIACLNK